MISERGFTALIEAICDAGVDFQGWPKALRLMAQSFHASAVLFGCNSPHLEEVFVIAPHRKAVDERAIAEPEWIRCTGREVNQITRPCRSQARSGPARPRSFAARSARQSCSAG